MSRILVIPDIHLKPELFDYAEKILKDGKADRAVCLMDIPDDWNCEIHINKYENTYDRAIKFAKDFPPPLIFSSIRVFSNESALRVSASASVLPMNIQD